MNSERLLLPIFKKIQMATSYHFAPWLSPNATTLNGYLLWSMLQINLLRAQGLIREVEIYPYFGKKWRYNTFYSIKPNKIANSHIEHQSGLIDVLMAFLYLYRDHEIEIDYSPKLKDKNGIYRPDALVKMRDMDGKEYHFLIEFERTRSAEAIFKEKLTKNEQLRPFKEYGLSEHTKILYICGHEWMNVFWRPIQYKTEPQALRGIQATNKQLELLMKKAKNLPDHKYRFLPYHYFVELNKMVWTTPKGNSVSLIS